jgi:hypothetical protein
MSEQIITPRQSRWEKTKNEIKASSPQVKQGLIMASVAVVLALAGAIGGCIKTASENSRLETDVSSKTAKIQDLEFEITPFRTLAVEKFNKADADSLKRLAETMTALERDYTQQLHTIGLLQSQLDLATASAKDARDRAELALTKIKRTMSDQQIATLTKKLMGLPKATITVMGSDTTVDGTQFAEQIAQVFANSGFETVRDFAMRFGTVGEHISVRSLESQPTCSVPIQKAFEEVGVHLTGSYNPGIPTNHVVINIGSNAR